jgi:hypothetical protein
MGASPAVGTEPAILGLIKVSKNLTLGFRNSLKPIDERNLVILLNIAHVV